MRARISRRTVDLSEFPEMVVIYLGMRVNLIRGVGTLLGFGPKIAGSVASKPAGLLRHENLVFSLFPPHVGMRQYWRDFASLEAWARSEPHRIWWREFLRNTKGVGFWHEAYFMSGGMEAVYDDMVRDIGFLSFAPAQEARGSMFSARGRARVSGSETGSAAVAEHDLYVD